jgi:hypothetical protein
MGPDHDECGDGRVQIIVDGLELYSWMIVS